MTEDDPIIEEMRQMNRHLSEIRTATTYLAAAVRTAMFVLGWLALCAFVVWAMVQSLSY